MKPLLWLLFIPLFLHCKKENTDGVDTPLQSPLVFDKLAVGQVGRYIGLTGKNYHGADYENYAYIDDTLVQRVVAKTADGAYLVEERILAKGAVAPELEFDKDSVYHYYFRVENDTLRITPAYNPFFHSRIFGYEILEKGLPLIDISFPEIEIKGWKTSLNYCECFQSGYVTNYVQFGRKFDRLNVIVENSAMAHDGPGETYVYSAKHGLIRASGYSWWTQGGLGWDWLPN